MVLVEYHYHGPGYDNMHWANVAQIETLIKWGDRFLWVLLFISLVIVMGYFQTIITYTFLGSILCMFYIAMIWRKYIIEKQEIAKTNLYNMYSMFVFSKEERER